MMRKNRSCYITTAEEIGSNLHLVRERRDLTQQNIANVLNIDRSTCAYYETGKTLIDIFTLIKLSKFYEIDIKFFILKNYKPSI